MAGEGRDLVINPGEFAFVQDRSKGNVSVCVGPLKQSFSETETVVNWDDAARRFVAADARTVQPFIDVPEGSYVVLRNPASIDDAPMGRATAAVELQNGTRIHKNGPLHFPLWPGQSAEVVQGHQLRSNEYLLARVYNEDSAREFWGVAVLKRQENYEDPAPEAEDAILKPSTVSAFEIDGKGLTTGQLIVIRGSEVAFFIPPTGVEVLPVQPRSKDYVRNAVTLERLEYCILLDENGIKEYRRGPAVVFPRPSERFVEKHGATKFGATELNPHSGVYVKVIQEYQDGDDAAKLHKVGEELFITGSEQPIYFPRPEHATIKYGDDSVVHYAVAVPRGEGRYVLDRDTGAIDLETGPRMLLPDPRRYVIIRRLLDPKTVDLFYPGNVEARAFNDGLRQLQEASGGYVTESAVRGAGERRYGALAASASSESTEPRLAYRSAAPAIVGDSMKRGTTHTPPRTITLDGKYDGAVAVAPWGGFAVQVVSKTGARRVVEGPATVLLEYDETLTVLELSTGTPKSDVNPQRTVYLRTRNNRISDIVLVDTSDQVRLKITLSYRVNFEDLDKAFAVENPIKFLTEHCSSLIRNAARKRGVEDLYSQAIDVVRDAILGPSDAGARKGRSFPENGMRVYDVEVLDVAIENRAISDLLVRRQHTAVEETLGIAQEEDRLARLKRKELVTREAALEREETTKQLALIEASDITRRHTVAESRADSEAMLALAKQQANREVERMIGEVQALVRARAEADTGLALTNRQRQLGIETEAHDRIMKSLTPDLVATLTRFADQDLMEKLVKHMSPYSILTNKDISTVVQAFVKGSSLDALFTSFASRALGQVPPLASPVPLEIQTAQAQ